MRLKIKSEWDGSNTDDVRCSKASRPFKKTGGESVDLSEAESIQGENEAIKVDFDLYTLISENEYFKGELVITQCFRQNNEHLVSNDDQSLFFKVPRYILSFIDGCPSRITTVEIQYDEDSDRVLFCSTENVEEKPRFTIGVGMDKILRIVELEGIKRNDDALYSIRWRQDIILRAISNYLKRNVQIMIYDPLLFEE